MKTPADILTDSFGRKHTYLRISLTERCNLRCTYCMPENGVALSPKSHLMTADEVLEIARFFVKAGVTKIRLTGGEPLVRKDFRQILHRLGQLPVQLAITTNAVIVDRFIEDFRMAGLNTINVSLDTLDREKFFEITRRDHFGEVVRNIDLLLREGFHTKVNTVLIKGFNDNEIIDLIEFSRKQPLSIRFIEFMPFDGNSWDKSKIVTYDQIIDRVTAHYGSDSLIRLEDAPNDTARNYRIRGFEGSFAIIGTVSHPFCDTCNRLRLTANGKIKNCLFSTNEVDLLGGLRQGLSLAPLVHDIVWRKKAVRAGLNSAEAFENPEYHLLNRSMITIGG